MARLLEPGLFLDAVERSLWYILGGVGYRDQTGLSGVFELVVISLYPDQEPSIVLDQLNNLPAIHFFPSRPSAETITLGLLSVNR